MHKISDLSIRFKQPHLAMVKETCFGFPRCHVISGKGQVYFKTAEVWETGTSLTVRLLAVQFYPNEGSEAESDMPSGIRSTRRLRSWMVEQVSSGRYPGLMWDDQAKTMFRIPWKHAGKQDFRSEEDAAIFKAWAEFKGKLTDAGRSDPASWKTRLRCALNKSPEFCEVAERSQLDISEPFKVYRLVPISEQGLGNVKTGQMKEVSERRRRSRRRSHSEDSEEELSAKMIKEQVTAVQEINIEMEAVTEFNTQVLEVTEPTVTMKSDGLNEIQLNVTIETSPAASTVLHSFLVSVQYLGQEMLRREVQDKDIRISYMPVPPVPPPPSSQTTFHRIPLPDPPISMASEPAMQAISTLLPFMEKGVMLTSTGSGVYAKRCCQGRVFWRGPHTPSSTSLNKMERTVERVMVFSRKEFIEELQNYQTSGGPPPQTSITMCFGEELLNTDDPATKLITVNISFPWAEQQIKEVDTLRESVSIFQNLASQSPLGEVTLNLIQIP